MVRKLQNQCFETGIIGSSGTCVAPCYVFQKRIEVERRSITEEQIPEEIKRLDSAIKKTADDIQNFRKRAEERHGEKYAAIFDSHLLMLEDPQFRPKLIARLEKDKINVESAVRERIDEIHKQFSAIEDPYLRERAIDIKDVGDRLLRHLLGLEEPGEDIDNKPYILIAEEVTPSELLNFAKAELKGICLDTGGATSHVAILSDALGIPSVFGLNDFSKKVVTGDILIIDTRNTPKIIVNPKSEVILAFEESIKNDNISSKKSEITADGVELQIGANVARVEEIPMLQKLGVKHISLFRSEFVFMESLDSPSEKYQTEVYSQLVKGVSGRVVLRTVDVGSDKPLKYLPLNEENNPAMGYRSVRFSLSRPDVLEPQLRAMVNASQYGDCKIIFPMLSVSSELKKISELFNKVINEIKPQKIPEWGIMLEVPSVAFMLNEVAKYTKYISIGTNDLVQFFFAVDRTNEKLSGYVDFLSMPFLKFLDQTITEANRLGIEVCVCGEMASDPAGFIALLGLGVQNFGMRPAVIEKMRELIPNLNRKNIKGFIKNILKRNEQVNVRQLIELTYL
ncbi:MAG: phosphoenolpyruvate--protein phosphotransferase [Candidatus Riflebacteria bacterium]|nr:phosphoenolpyruvate--protein phosphotransferase [Candidatus Riflebacteria bacterium]